MDLSSATLALSSLENVTYLAVFLLFVVEGPVLNFVAAFAASLGYFNVFIILALAFAGNVVGDFIYYAIGRLGNNKLTQRIISKYFKPQLKETTLPFLIRRPLIALSIIKMTPVLPVPGLIYAGIKKMNMLTYTWCIILLSAIQVVVITTIGFYSGSFFSQMFTYFNKGVYLISAIIIASVIFWMLLKQVSKKINSNLKKIEEEMDINDANQLLVKKEKNN